MLSVVEKLKLPPPVIVDGDTTSLIFMPKANGGLLSTAAAAGPPSPQAAHFTTSAALRSKQLPHSQDPVAGLNIAASEDGFTSLLFSRGTPESFSLDWETTPKLNLGMKSLGGSNPGLFAEHERHTFFSAGLRTKHV